MKSYSLFKKNFSILIIILISMAVQGICQAAAQDKNDLIIPEKYGQIKTLCGNKEFEQALAITNQAILQNPLDVEAYIRRGYTYFKQGQTDLAIANYDKAIELNPQNADLYHARGFCYEKLGDGNLAVADFTKAIELSPQNAQLYYGRGDTRVLASGAFSRHKLASIASDDLYELITADYAQAIGLGIKNNAQLYVNRATIYSMNKEYVKAIDDFTKALELIQAGENIENVTMDNPEKEFYLYNLTNIPVFSKNIIYMSRANAYKEIQQYDKAIDDFSKIENNFTTSSELGNLYMLKGDYKTARELFEAPGEHFKTPDEQFAVSLINSSRIDVLDALEKISLEPSTVENLEKHSKIYLNIGRVDLALANYTKIIEMASSDTEAAKFYYLRAYCHFVYRKNYEQCLNDIERYLALLPQDAQAHYNSARSYEMIAQYRKSEKERQHLLELALTCYNKAIELCPPKYKPFYLNERAYFYKRIKKTDLYLAELNNQIAANPDNYLYYQERGGIYESLGQNDLALKDYSQAIELNGQKDNTLYYLRARVHYKQNNYDSYISDYSKPIELTSQNQEENLQAYIKRARAYETIENDKLALKDYTKAIELSSSPKYRGYSHLYYKRGDVYYNLKKYDLYISDYSKPIKTSSDSQAYFERGQAYESIGRYKLAIKDYNTAIAEVEKSSSNQSASYRYARGRAYYKNKQYDLAVADLNQVISRFVLIDWKQHYQRALALEAAGYKVEAMESYRLCLKHIESPYKTNMMRFVQPDFTLNPKARPQEIEKELNILDVVETLLRIPAINKEEDKEKVLVRENAQKRLEDLEKKQ